MKFSKLIFFKFYYIWLIPRVGPWNGDIFNLYLYAVGKFIFPRCTGTNDHWLQSQISIKKSMRFNHPTAKFVVGNILDTPQNVFHYS